MPLNVFRSCPPTPDDKRCVREAELVFRVFRWLQDIHPCRLHERVRNTIARKAGDLLPPCNGTHRRNHVGTKCINSVVKVKVKAEQTFGADYPADAVCHDGGLPWHTMTFPCFLFH